MIRGLAWLVLMSILLSITLGLPCDVKEGKKKHSFIAQALQKLRPSRAPGACQKPSGAPAKTVSKLQGTWNCRQIHENCSEIIKSGEQLYGLLNNRTVTVYHCDCDENFHKCLKKDGSAISKELGDTYFNVMQIPCFRRAKPVIGCDKYIKQGLKQRCVSYKFDLQSPELTWQWFDAQEF